jgi:hypothetical protein
MVVMPRDIRSPYTIVYDSEFFASQIEGGDASPVVAFFFYHELGHIVYRHVTSGPTGYLLMQENEADEYAISMLSADNNAVWANLAPKLEETLRRFMGQDSSGLVPRMRRLSQYFEQARTINSELRRLDQEVELLDERLRQENTCSETPELNCLYAVKPQTGSLPKSSYFEGLLFWKPFMLNYYVHKNGNLYALDKSGLMARHQIVGKKIQISGLTSAWKFENHRLRQTFLVDENGVVCTLRSGRQTNCGGQPAVGNYNVL